MGKKLLLIASSLLLIFALCSCQNQEAKKIEWKDFSSVQGEMEEYIYNIYNVSDNKKIGISTMTVKSNPESNTIDFIATEDLKLQDEKDQTFNIVQDMKVTSSDSYLPLTSELSLDNNGSIVSLKAEYDYDNNKVNIEAKVNEENQKASANIKEPVVDNNQLLQLIRFLPLEVGYEQLLNNMVVSSASNSPCKVVVTKEETITVNNKEIKCYLVELRFTGIIQKCWYSVDKVELIKYQNNKVYYQIDN